jgi:hypothetical protein
MGAIVIRTRFDEGTESAKVATSATCMRYKNQNHGDHKKNYLANVGLNCLSNSREEVLFLMIICFNKPRFPNQQNYKLSLIR